MLSRIASVNIALSTACYFFGLRVAERFGFGFGSVRRSYGPVRDSTFQDW
jgi:hypothetical protein